MPKSLFLFILFLPLYLGAQFSDSFSDGELDINPFWKRNSNDFEVKDERLHNVNSNGGSVLYGISSKILNAEYAFYSFDFELQINPSSANYFDFYILSDTIVELAQNGYFIRVGNTKDEISFYKKVQGVSTEIISGTDNELNKSSNKYQVQVLMEAGHKWSLWVRNLESGIPTLYGSAVDSSIVISSHCGILIKQTGATAIGKCYIDNLYFGEDIRDTSRPAIVQVQTSNNTQVVLIFNEEMGLTDTNNFFIENLGKPQSAAILQSDKRKIELYFKIPLRSNSYYKLKHSGSKDINGNLASYTEYLIFTFSADTPKFEDLIFTEVMSNPTPTLGFLPEEEYIELWNRSNKIISLKNCFLSDAVSKMTLPDSLIRPGEYCILTKSSNIALKKYGRWIGMSSFPNLNNDADQISLTNSLGEMVCYLNYNQNWHSNISKQNGGWSLEKLDTTLYCVNEFNWASNNSIGGSPGLKNPTARLLDKAFQFSVLRSFVPDNHATIIYFSQNLDSATALNPLNYALNSSINPTRVQFNNNEHNSVICYWMSAVDSNVIYLLSIKNVYSCFGMQLDDTELKVGLARQFNGDVNLRINEILFDPKGDNADYVELVNVGPDILDLAHYRLCNKDANGDIKESTVLPYYTIFPGDYILLSTDPEKLKDLYVQTNQNTLIKTTTFPSFPNESGWLAITTTTGIPVDEFAYSSSFHSPLLLNADGVSLEKVNPAYNSNDKTFWTSATASSGYGTPGLKNSQSVDTGLSKAKFTLQDKWFSPDNDGIQDFLIIHYQFEKAGYFINSTVFSANGIPICHPHQNYSLAQSGEIIWNGANSQGILPAGNYVFLIDYFSVTGKTDYAKFTFSILK